MRLASRHLFLGALSPNPRDLSLFSRQNGCSVRDFKGTGLACPLAFPAAEPVARVASLRCPIPSGSGRLSINEVASQLNEKAANGDYPLNFVSHDWGSPQIVQFHPRNLSMQALRIAR